MRAENSKYPHLIFFRAFVRGVLREGVVPQNDTARTFCETIKAGKAQYSSLKPNPDKPEELKVEGSKLKGGRVAFLVLMLQHGNQAKVMIAAKIPSNSPLKKGRIL